MPHSFTRTHFIFLCSVIAFAVAAVTLLGWAADIAVFRSLLPGFPAMRPLSGIGFMLLAAGIGATLLRPENRISVYLPTAAGLCVSFASALALVTSLQRVAGVEEIIKLPPLPSVIEASRPDVSPLVPLVFLLLGISLTLTRVAGGRYRSDLVPAVALAAAYAVGLGVIYHAEAPLLFANADSIAPATVLLFTVLSLAMSARNTQGGIIRLLASSGLGGSAARRLVPAVVVIPTIVGLLGVSGIWRGLYNPGLGWAMTTFILVLLMLAIVVFYSRAVHAGDRVRRRVEAELAEKEMRYRELFDYSQGLICVHDLEGRLSTVNRAAQTLLGYSESEMIGKSLKTYVPADRWPHFDAYLRKVTHEGLADGLLELEARSGRRVILRYYNVLASEEGKEPYVLGHAQDVTELLAAQQELKNMSLRDDLTGLYNRRGFLTLAEQQLKLERHNGTARGLTLLFGDMDGLKAINDTYGHEAGSQAISTLAGILRSAVRTADIVSRWGGDEFVILTVGAQDENAQLMVDRILEQIDEYNGESRDPYLIGCSIGIASVDPDRSIEETIAEADEAMYAEKRRRKEERGEVSDAPRSFSRPWTGSTPSLGPF